MKFLHLILAISVFSMMSCNGQFNTITQSFEYIDTIKTFKREIPSNDVFYQLDKDKQKQLGLDSLENGFANLQIRLWYDYSLIRERRLLVISNIGTKWTATVYYMQVDWDGQTETIRSKKVYNLRPKSGWAIFSKKLLDLKIVTLPTQDDVKGYSGGMDGSTYNVEIATKNQYRFYGYWEPEQFQDKFWQAKYMADILNLIELELGVTVNIKTLGN